MHLSAHAHTKAVITPTSASLAHGSYYVFRDVAAASLRGSYTREKRILISHRAQPELGDRDEVVVIPDHDGECRVEKGLLK